MRDLKVGLVLGAGGLVGLAYHLGVLHALEVEGGVSLDSVNLLVGTSAGSVAAAYVASGWPVGELWDELMAVPSTSPSSRAGTFPASRSEDSPIKIMAPAYSNVAGMLRRAVGSAFVLNRSLVRFPVPGVPAAVTDAFPGGMFVMADGERRLADELPARWPGQELWLCAFDIVGGRREVIDSESDPALSLPQAVRASCAIPGIYEPVRQGRRLLVDGGIHSTTNLDLAVTAGCDLVIGVAPMAFDVSDRPGPIGALARHLPEAMLSAEVSYARSKGVRVLLFKPSSAEVRMHGVNLMRRQGLDLVASAAYESTHKALAAEPVREVLTALAA